MTQTKKVTKTKRATEVEDAPMFKVLLIGDEEYNREHVVMSIQDIVPDTDNTRVGSAGHTAGANVISREMGGSRERGGVYSCRAWP